LPQQFKNKRHLVIPEINNRLQKIKDYTA